MNKTYSGLGTSFNTVSGWKLNDSIATGLPYKSNASADIIVCGNKEKILRAAGKSIDLEQALLRENDAQRAAEKALWDATAAGSANAVEMDKAKGKVLDLADANLRLGPNGVAYAISALQVSPIYRPI